MISQWPHAPVHTLGDAGAYIVTAGTYRKLPILGAPDRLSHVRDRLFALAEQYGWNLQAWAILTNHYHFVATHARGSTDLHPFIKHFHSETARHFNSVDRTAGRKVWYQYWDRRITYQRSYLARLQYVHQNPVHHGITRNAVDYGWCSARWFEVHAKPSFHKVVSSFKIDRVNVPDSF